MTIYGLNGVDNTYYDSSTNGDSQNVKEDNLGSSIFVTNPMDDSNVDNIDTFNDVDNESVDKISSDTQPLTKKEEKNAEIEKEYETLRDKYIKYKQEMINKNEAINFSACLEKVKTDLKSNNNWNKITKKAYKMLKEYAKDDARNLVEHKIDDSTADSKRGIRKEVMGQINKDDDFQKDAVKDLKQDRKLLARRNKVEAKAKELGNLSYTEFADEIGKRSHQYNFVKKIFASHKIGDRIAEKFKNCQDIKNDDGTYNMEKLKDILLKRIGQDYKLNLSNDKNMAELTNLKRELKAITGEDFSNNEVKVLVNMFDFKREHKDHTPQVAKALVSGVGSAISAFNASPDINMSQHQFLEFTLKKTANAEAIEELKKAGVDITSIDEDTVHVKMDQFQKLSLNKAVKNALKGLGTGILTSAVFDFVFGNGKDEQSCISISDYDINNERYTDADKYKEYVANIYGKNPEKVEALHLLIDAYKEEYGENWHAKFQQKLRDVAGIGSKLNPEECKTLKYQKVDEPPKPPKPPKPPEQTPTCTIVVDKEEDTQVVIDTLTRKETKAWKETVHTIYPCLVQTYGEKKAIRMLKLVQGIRDGNYSTERMDELYKATLNKKKAELKALNIDGFDSSYYADVLNADDVPERMFVPDKIGDCDRKRDAKVGKVRVKRSGSKGRKAPTTKYRGHTRIGDTTISICGDPAHKIDPSKVDSTIDNYKKRNTGVRVDVIDNRRKK